MFVICEKCGANLDPNERCDCEVVITRNNKSLFTAGTKVRVVSIEDNDPYEPRVGSIGKVAAIDEDLIAVEIEDPNYKGHSCSGSVPSGRGCWILSEDLLIV